MVSEGWRKPIRQREDERGGRSGVKERGGREGEIRRYGERMSR